MLQFIRSIFVTDDDGMGMLLQAIDRPHVVDGLFYTVTTWANPLVNYTFVFKLTRSKDCWVSSCLLQASRARGSLNHFYYDSLIRLLFLSISVNPGRIN